MFQGMEYIYEVYKEKSFSKSCCCSFHFAAFFKRQCKTWKNRIGYPIFDRSTKPLQLTEVGKHYIQAVEKVMDIENNLEKLPTGSGKSQNRNS